jgi:hypothetical protein
LQYTEWDIQIRRQEGYNKYRCKQVANTNYSIGAHMQEIQNTKIKVQTDRKCKMQMQASRINKIKVQKRIVYIITVPNTDADR